MRERIIGNEPVWSPATDARTREVLHTIPGDAHFFEDEEPTEPEALAHIMERESDRLLRGGGESLPYAEYRVLGPEERWNGEPKTFRTADMKPAPRWVGEALPEPMPIRTVAELRKAEREMFCDSIGFAPTRAVRIGPVIGEAIPEPLPEFVPSDGVPVAIGAEEVTKPKSAPAKSVAVFTEGYPAGVRL